MRVAIQTGTFATLFAMGDLVTFCEALFQIRSTSNIVQVLMSQTFLSGMFTFPIGRIYTNVGHYHMIPDVDTDDQDGNCQTMMDTLNMREALRDLLNESRTVRQFMQALFVVS